MIDELGKWVLAVLMALLCTAVLVMVSWIVWNVVSHFPWALAGLLPFTALTIYIREKVWS